VTPALCIAVVLSYTSTMSLFCFVDCRLLATFTRRAGTRALYYAAFIMLVNYWTLLDTELSQIH